MKKSKTTTEEKRLAEVNRRGEIIREVTKVVKSTINDTVNNLMKVYPEHNKIIRSCLGGEAQRLLAEYEEVKRKNSYARAVKEQEAKEKAKKKAAREAAAKKKAASN